MYPNALRFNLSPQDIQQISEKVIADHRKLLDDVVSIPANSRTFQNTVKVLVDEPFLPLVNSCYFLSQVSTSEEVRKASTEANKKLEEFSVDRTTREDLYKAVQDYIDNNAEEISRLDAQDKRLLEKIIKTFKRSGLALPSEKRARVKEIKQKLAELCIQFQQNVTEDKTELWFTKEELDGLSQEMLDAHTQKDGKYRFTLQYPDLFPLLKNCKVDETRKKMRTAANSKCMKENVPIFEEILQLRDEEAKLMGFDSHADFELELKMAKNSQTVLNFLDDLIGKLEEPAKKDISILLELKRKEKEALNQPFDGNLNLWDLQYYHNMLLQNEYSINHEEIKEYFPMQKVTQGLLDIFSDVLGMKFVELGKDKSHVWHEDVRQFEVYDSPSNDFMGHLYLDLYPREGKYSHAAEFDLLKGFLRSDGSKSYPAAALVANFNKPTADKPSLLRFDEVVTYFHELGHAVHELCSTAKYFIFAGTNVEKDFVEAPSQMLENWCFEKEVLEKISGHYKDLSKSLPDELRERLIKAKNVCEGILTRRQLHFGKFDMLAHTSPTQPVNTETLWHKCMKEIALFHDIPGTNGTASFGHLAGGYSAGYYGYLWSKVYSCDMFERFKKEGVFNKDVGRAYRKFILSTGGTRDSMDALVDFLGRQPNSEAFLRDIGVAQ